MLNPHSKALNLSALLIIGSLPSLGVLSALYFANGISGTTLWFIAKLGVLVLPVAWWRLIDKQHIRVTKPDSSHIFIGVLAGLCMAGGIYFSYVLFAEGKFDATHMRTLLSTAGLSSPMPYIVMAAYWSFINSLVEEYFFRWFCFVKAEKVFGKLGGVVVAALIFTLHHSVALAFYVPWHLNVLASVGVFGAAIVWSVLYTKTRNIWAGYVSHVMADVAIFWIGYQILFP